MKIRETVKQIKNEFLFNANDFMKRVDATQQLITFRQKWKVKENVKPSQVGIYLDTKGVSPINEQYFALDLNKPFFGQNVNCAIPFPKGVLELYWFEQNKDTGAMQMVFPDTTRASYGKWACRHYAMLDIVLRYKGLKGAHSIKRAELFTDGERMLEYLWEKPALATTVNWICHEGQTDRYFVEMNGKTDFLYEMFKEMQLPKRGEKAVLPMCISSWFHAMTLTLKISHRKDGKVQYSVSFYDPNITFNHRKIRFDNLEDLRAFDWERLIPKESIAVYASFDCKDVPEGQPIKWAFSPLPEKELDDLFERMDWSNERRLRAADQIDERNYPLIKDEK